MRHTFTLLIGFREDLRGTEQRHVSDQIQDFAAKQDIQSFVLENDTFTFMARPDLVDVLKDYYEVDGLRHSFKPWLDKHPFINTFELKPITDVSQVLPKVGDAAPEPVIKSLTIRGKFFRAISK